MPLKVLKDTTIPRVVAEGTNNAGEQFVEKERVAYREGDIVLEQDVDPDFIDRLEDDEDGHLSSVVEVISRQEAEKILSDRVGDVVVIPEHEAEAEVLAQDGRDVATHEEKIEANLNGDVQPEPEGPVDLTEGRKSEDPEGVRVTEVDDARRGDGEAPEPKPAAEEDQSNKDWDYEDLKTEAKRLNVKIHGKKKEKLAADVAAAQEEEQENSGVTAS